MRASRLLLIVMALLVASSTAYAAKGPAKPPSGTDPGKGPQWWGPPPGAKNVPVAIGEVANVSPTSIGIQTKDGLKTFAVNEQTKVMVRGRKATINDVKVGDPARVRFRPVENGVPIALAIQVPKPRVAGKILSIANGVVTVAGKQGEAKFVVTGQTRYRSHGYQGTLADLRVGYWAAAAGAMNGADYVAEEVEFRPEVARGAVVAKSGDVITVKTTKQANIVCLGSPATAVLIRPRIGPNKKGTLADVQVGMPCDIGFHPNPQGQAQVLWIDLLVGQ